MFKAVCFDFDYTLGDCTDSIVAGFQYGLTGLGWPAPDREAVRRTVGFLLEDAYSMLTGDLDPENQARFRALFKTSRSRSEVVATFLAILELCKANRIHLAGTAEDCTVTSTVDDRPEELDVTIDSY